MTFEEAKELLMTCKRNELRDHAFGDKEVYFDTPEGEQIAEGYVGMATVSISVQGTEFQDDEAAELLKLGHLVKVERNDGQGDDHE